MALEQITDDGFPGFKSLDFIGQMIVGVEPLGRYWFWSGLADALSYNTLDQAQAETSPDRIVGLIASHNEVLVFGERTIEPWAFAPTDTATFQLQTGSVIESGCASGDTIKRLDNSVFYLTSSGQIARLNGYTPLVISTAAIESAIRDLKWSRAFAFTYEENGHSIYYITFPDGQTFGYDVRQNAWHRRESYGIQRWRVSCMEKSNGKWYAGDYSNGRIYLVSYKSVFEGCEIMPRKLRTGVLHHDTNRMRVNSFRVIASAGAYEFIEQEHANAKSIAIGSFYEADYTALDDCEPMEGGFFQVRYSDDGAENWSSWRDFESPRSGGFLQPMVTRRLGMTTHRVWELMDTSNRPQDVVAASIIVE